MRNFLGLIGVAALLIVLADGFVGQAISTESIDLPKAPSQQSKLARSLGGLCLSVANPHPFKFATRELRLPGEPPKVILSISTTQRVVETCSREGRFTPACFHQMELERNRFLLAPNGLICSFRVHGIARMRA